MEKKFDIRTSQIPQLSARLEVLGRKAVKLGFTAPTFEVVDTFLTDKKIEITTVSIDCTDIVVAGWELIAKIEFEGDAPIIGKSPAFEGEIPDRFQQVNTKVCDHCKARRDRNRIFLLRNDAGQIIQVGGNCLADFLGRNAATATWCLSILEEVELMSSDDDRMSGGFSKSCFLVEDALTITAAVIRTEGWVSGALAQKLSDERDEHVAPSSAKVANLMWPSAKFAAEAKQFRTQVVNEQDRKVAQDTIAWAKDVDASGNNFLQNIKVLANAGSVSTKRLSMVCAMIVGKENAARSEKARAERKADWEAKKAAKAARDALSQHVGEEGDKIESTVTIERLHNIRGRFGVTTIVSMRDEGGNVLKWFASNCPSEVKEGERLTIKGTVKAHGEFRDVKETTLTRCKVA